MRSIAAVLVIACAPLAHGEPAHSHGEPGPAPGLRQGDERRTPARAPGRYRSAFDDYRPFRADEPLRDWREVNEEVRAAGGHAGLLKGDAHGTQPQGAAAKEQGRK